MPPLLRPRESWAKRRNFDGFPNRLISRDVFRAPRSAKIRIHEIGLAGYSVNVLVEMAIEEQLSAAGLKYSVYLKPAA